MKIPCIFSKLCYYTCVYTAAAIKSSLGTYQLQNSMHLRQQYVLVSACFYLNIILPKICEKAMFWCCSVRHISLHVGFKMRDRQTSYVCDTEMSVFNKVFKFNNLWRWYQKIVTRVRMFCDMRSYVFLTR